MASRHHPRAPCEEEARERFFPVCHVGRILMLIGLGMAFFSFVFGFWMALLGAGLILTGFLVAQCC